LRASPIILGHDMRVFVGNSWFIRIGKAIRNREYNGSPDSGSIEIRDQITSTDALWSWRGSRACFGAVQMLVMVDDFSEQREGYEDDKGRNDYREASC
jgi:hypothetical protein